MARIVWSENAVVSLEKIAEFIEKNSIFYAKKTVEDINNCVKILKDYPNSGRIVP
ncbi:MAG: type II toxin-antitoxin system RelE/ParE family toxin [Spirochaetales bacterium]|nr:type II toxin-antitoxin system RelE/ParE family toxin [Spirochaetales bacterium]